MAKKKRGSSASRNRQHLLRNRTLYLPLETVSSSTDLDILSNHLTDLVSCLSFLKFTSLDRFQVGNNWFTGLTSSLVT